MSEKLSPAAQRSLSIGFELVRKGLLLGSSIEGFTSENPLCRVVDQPVFDPRRAQNVIESVSPIGNPPQEIRDKRVAENKDEISKGVTALEDIHHRYHPDLLPLEPPHLETLYRKPSHHKKKHYH